MFQFLSSQKLTRFFIHQDGELKNSINDYILQVQNDFKKGDEL